MPTSPPTTTLTKEQLRNALIQRGFQTPPASARKEEFQKIYDEKVLPNQTRSEFSSDDEQDSTPNGDNVDAQEKDVVLEVKEMSDQQIYDAIKARGGNCGPVVESTRNLYQNQLLALMSKSTPINLQSLKELNGHHSEASPNGNGNGGFSDSDDEAAVETASRASRSSRGSTAASASPTTPKRRGRPSLNRRPDSAAVTPVPHPAVATTVESARNQTPPNQYRIHRRSETPKTQIQRPVGFTNLESRVPERSRQMERNEPYQIGATGVSYFKERPGYASTTTSNVLPRKPTMSAYNDDTVGNQRKNISEDKKGSGSMSSLMLAIVGLVAAVAVVGVGYYMKTMMFTEDEGPQKDELAQLLENMEINDQF